MILAKTLTMALFWAPGGGPGTPRKSGPGQKRCKFQQNSKRRIVVAQWYITKRGPNGAPAGGPGGRGRVPWAEIGDFDGI